MVLIRSIMAKPTLLTLPFEIRETIWKYACDDSVVRLWYFRCYYPTPQVRIFVNENRQSILGVCRQIYAEARLLFMQSTQIRFRESIQTQQLFRISAPAWRQNITDLEVTTDKNAALMVLPKEFPRLKILRLCCPSTQAWGPVSTVREWAGLQILRRIQMEADVVELMRQCPNVSLTCSAVVFMGYGGHQLDLLLPYVSLTQNISRLKLLMEAKLVEFRSQTMAITFQCRVQPYGVGGRLMMSKEDFDEGDYAIEPKLVELPTTG